MLRQRVELIDLRSIRVRGCEDRWVRALRRQRLVQLFLMNVAAREAMLLD